MTVNWTRGIAGLLLLLTLQFGQLWLAVHHAQHDLDGHDGSCELCLHASPLDQLASATPPLALPPPRAPAPTAAALLPVRLDPCRHFAARAPPATLHA